MVFLPIGSGDFNLFTSEISLTSNSLSSSITVEALRDDEDMTDEMFESFRLVLTHGPNVLPPSIILGSTVVTIENVGTQVVCTYSLSVWV